uniref:Ig-like domain-containing protein n=1 Tax=Eptatretus burgeri TaxID=7764 RepID=A0A8C4WW33_EPTBU
MDLVSISVSVGACVRTCIHNHISDFYGPILLVLEMLDHEHCGCSERSSLPSIDLSVSQQTTTITTNMNRWAEFYCYVSFKSRSTDDPMVYWYKHSPNSMGGKIVFSTKSPSVEYINRVKQTVHEIRKHLNMRTRRFTLEILQLNVKDSGDYFCVTKIKTRDGWFGNCGEGTRLEVVGKLCGIILGLSLVYVSRTTSRNFKHVQNFTTYSAYDTRSACDGDRLYTRYVDAYTRPQRLLISYS